MARSPRTEYVDSLPEGAHVLAGVVNGETVIYVLRDLPQDEQDALIARAQASFAGKRRAAWLPVPLLGLSRWLRWPHAGLAAGTVTAGAAVAAAAVFVLSPAPHPHVALGTPPRSPGPSAAASAQPPGHARSASPGAHRRPGGGTPMVRDPGHLPGHKHSQGATPAPEPSGSSGPRPAPQPSPSTQPQPRPSPSLSPSPLPSVTVSPTPTCLHLLGITVCASLGASL